MTTPCSHLWRRSPCQREDALLPRRWLPTLAAAGSRQPVANALPRSPTAWRARATGFNRARAADCASLLAELSSPR